MVRDDVRDGVTLATNVRSIGWIAVLRGGALRRATPRTNNKGAEPSAPPLRARQRTDATLNQVAARRPFAGSAIRH